MTGATIPDLEQSFGSELVYPDAARYDELRKVFNGMIDRRPAVIARCRTAADVAAAVEHARESDLPVSVHGGGHNVVGYAVCDGGVMIDLRPMKGIQVDPDRLLAHAEAGLTWGEFDAATQAHGLAVTGGRMSTTGIAGFTLGSGSGWLERKLGLAADNLISAEVVLADGSIVTASETENGELFWGLRGGGGNFGVVTSFTFRLAPVGPIVLGGMLMHPGPKAGAVLRFFREFMAAAPDEVGAAVALLTAPPGPPIPEPARGKPAVGIVACYAGRVDEGERALAPLREFGPPAIDHIQPMPYTEVQKLIDPAAPAGMQNYWGGAFLPELSDGAIDALCASAAAVPSPLSQILIIPGGGQIDRVPDDATALAGRQAAFNTHLVGMWADPRDRDVNVGWLRDLETSTRPYTTGTAFANFLGEAGDELVLGAFGAEKYARLVALKDRYDPENLFRLNANIKPSGA
jgi:hypothetical protein